MRAVDLIVRKRDGHELSREEIRDLVGGYVDGSVPDYQMAAWLMAVFHRGMSSAETAALTRAMIDSGTTMDLSRLPGPLVDKHSTGGVGDKVSLLLAPAAAACGVHVPMMSGRSLGHTGGTLDKLESMSGYTTALSPSRFRRVIARCGYAMTGQSRTVVPADRKLYALRDVTGTVESVPLITASILSKKFAEGAESLVFDVKTGRGAFMKSLEASRSLASALTETGRDLGRRTKAVITRMDSPLGRMVGNFLEVEEAAWCLMGGGAPSGYSAPDDLMDVTARLTAWMLVAGGLVADVAEGERRCREVIADGTAWERFLQNVELQGGDPAALERDLGRRRAPVRVEVLATETGVISETDAYEVGMAAVGLGVGRNRTGDAVDPDVGVQFEARVGDRVGVGDRIATIWGRDERSADGARSRIASAVRIGAAADAPAGMIVEEFGAL